MKFSWNMSKSNSQFLKNQRNPWHFGSIFILVIFLFGVILCVKTGIDKDRRLRNKLLQNAVILKNSVNLSDLSSLKFDSSDIQNPAYIRLREQFKKVKICVEEFRRTYIITRNKNNQFIKILDSEFPSSKSYVSTSQVNPVLNQILKQTFDNKKEVTFGPYLDCLGKCVTAIIPIENKTNSNVEYAVCVELNANDWNFLIVKECLMPFILTLLFLAIYIFLIIRQKRTDREKEHLEFLTNSLKESEAKYRKIFENVQDVFFQVDTSGLIIEMSPSIERYSGYKRSELIGTKMENYYFNAEHRALFVQALFQQGEVADYEIQMKERNGTAINASTNAHLLFDENNKIIGIEGTIRDISDRKKVENELIRANSELSTINAMKDKFFSIIAHDIKNPFSHILGFASLLKTNANNLSKEQIEEYSQIIHSSAYKTYKLLEELLAWSMSQSGKLNINKELIPINILCDDIIQQYSLLALSKEITIKTEYNHLSVTFIDKPTIQTVIRNLINNAIKFTDYKGSILVKTTESENTITINIIDNGIGIEKDDLEKLFRLDTSTKTIGTSEEKGSGLGLILCKEFVEKNGGMIGAISEYGEGSCFYLNIPIQKI